MKDYHRAVLDWLKFHELLPSNGSNKLSVYVRGNSWKTDLFACAEGLQGQRVVPGIRNNDIMSLTSWHDHHVLRWSV